MSVKSETDGRGMESTASKLRVELLADMLVGGFQVLDLCMAKGLKDLKLFPMFSINSRLDLGPKSRFI